jgi:hypothetical protein
MYYYGTLKPVKVISRRGVKEQEDKGGDDQTRILYIYI